MTKKFEFLKLDNGKLVRNILISYCLCILLILLGALLPGTAEESGYEAVKDKFASIFKPEDTPAVGGIESGSFDETKLSIKAQSQKVKTKSSLKLKAFYKGEDVTNKVVWKVNDTKIAYINNEGKLWGRKVGEITVSATLKSDTQVTAEKEFQVVYNYRILFRMLIGHIGIFFVLGILGMVLFLNIFPQNVFLSAVVSQGIGVSVAIISELLQLPSITYKRASTVEDALINIASLTIAIGVFTLIYFIRQRNLRRNVN